ncbi:MAG: hypothetical protein GF344_17035 [Chitinivibrionales bacterium]|nr:hypothetical protein [Chitinivibrionales bacterium]MBD3358389.1 hypothetical protein [Chitinivibrionales bacterium]
MCRMELYVLRHGIAVELGEEGAETDFDRRLSRAGIRKTRAAVRGLKMMKCSPGRVVSSPLPRAWETAQIAATELGCDSEVAPSDLLKPGVPVAKTRDWVIEQEVERGMMLVGHMPGLARLVSYLLAGDDRVEIVLKKSGACLLTRTIARRRAPYRLDWLLQPGQLRTFAEMD